MTVQLASGNVVSQWQLAGTSSDQVKQSIGLQLAEVLMTGATRADHYLGGGWLCKGSYGRFWLVA